MPLQGFIYLQNILLYHQVLSVLPAMSRKCVQSQGMYLFSTQITLDPAKDSKVHVLIKPLFEKLKFSLSQLQEHVENFL